MFLHVSIHVPAKGTTSFFSAADMRNTVSIHVPAKGTTRANLMGHLILLVSIHVPAKGTTNYIRTRLIALDRFNPRSREGNDAVSSPAQARSCGFNPRSREGNDIDELRAGGGASGFQSTFPRRERPSRSISMACAMAVSIHVPAKGTTITFFVSFIFIIDVSIHVPAKGTTELL